MLVLNGGILERDLIGFFEVLLLEVVLVGRYLMVLPLVHEIVGVLWILIDAFVFFMISQLQFNKLFLLALLRIILLKIDYI